MPGTSFVSKLGLLDKPAGRLITLSDPEFGLDAS
jgi:hypothetical protein